MSEARSECVEVGTPMSRSPVPQSHGSGHASLGESLRDYKASLRVWMSAVYTENICYNSPLHPNVYRLKDGSLQGLLLHAEPASIFSCMQ